MGFRELVNSIHSRATSNIFCRGDNSRLRVVGLMLFNLSSL